MGEERTFDLDAYRERMRREQARREVVAVIEAAMGSEPVTDLPRGGGPDGLEDYVAHAFADLGVDADDSVVGAIASAAAIEALDCADQLIGEAVRMARCVAWFRCL